MAITSKIAALAMLIVECTVARPQRIYGATNVPTSPSCVRLGFSEGSQTENAAHVKWQAGITYTLSLQPEHETQGNVIVLDLVLQDGPDRRNLLEPTSRWHGWEPFIFAASDFKDGKTGETRSIHLRRLGTYLTIRPVDATVRPVPAGDLSSPTQAFNNFTIHACSNFRKV
jgi:hypothetical protein